MLLKGLYFCRLLWHNFSNCPLRESWSQNKRQRTSSVRLAKRPAVGRPVGGKTRPWLSFQEDISNLVCVFVVSEQPCGCEIGAVGLAFLCLAPMAGRSSPVVVLLELLDCLMAGIVIFLCTSGAGFWCRGLSSPTKNLQHNYRSDDKRATLLCVVG